MNVSVFDPLTDVARRSGPAPIYAFDEFVLDTGTQTLRRDGKPVGVGGRAIQLLIALVENRHRVVGKEELIQIAWPRSTVVENNLPVAIFALRRAFEDRFYIRNAYGKGYRFVPQVTVRVAPSASVPKGRDAVAELPSIAVLPFVEAGAGGGQSVFGTGIAEDILAELSRNRWLTVIAHNSSFAMGIRGVPAQEVAQQFGVRYVLEGTVRQSGSRVRVTAHLNDVRSNTHLVSERFDRELTDIFDVQDEITARIVEAMRPALYEAEQDRSLRKHPDSIDAWAAYQRAIWHLAAWSDGHFDEAVVQFRRAIELAPGYARGYYGMAKMLVQAGSGYRPNAPADWQAQAEAYARQAVELDSRDSEAHETLASTLLMRGDHAAALATVDEALRLNANDALAHATRGATLIFSGRPEEGVAEMQACIRLNPRDPRIRTRRMHIGLGLYFMDDLSACEEMARGLVGQWPTYGAGHRLLGMVLSDMGRHVEALASLTTAAASEATRFDEFTRARMAWYSEPAFARMLASMRRAGWTGSGD